jgi:hypothetical protein
MHGDNLLNKKISENVSVKTSGDLSNGFSSSANNFYHNNMFKLNPPSHFINLVVFF